MSRDIFLNIDRIVLHGLDHVDRFALAEALQQTLQEQIFSNHALTGAELSRVRTRISLPRSFDATQLGQSLGQGLVNVIVDSKAAKNSVHKTRQGGRHHA